MRKFKITAVLAAAVSMGQAAFGAAPTTAVGAPVLELEATSPDRFAPGGSFRYGFKLVNVGDQATSAPTAVDITLPVGVTAVAVESASAGSAGLFEFFWNCGDVSGATSIECERANTVEPFGSPFSLPIEPGQADPIGAVLVEVVADPGLSGPQIAEFEASGGGATASATATRVARAGATPEFRITEWDGRIGLDETGKLQAGGHPKDIVTSLRYSTREDVLSSDLLPETGQHNLTADLPAGFVGAPAAAPTCELKDLTPATYEPLPGEVGVGFIPACPIDSIVGTIGVYLTTGGNGPFLSRGINRYDAPIFNMKPSPGEPARFGFVIHGVPLELTANARTDGDLGVQLTMIDTSQSLPVVGATTTFWGVPADSSHDRHRCQYYRSSISGDSNHGDCSTGTPGRPADGINPSTLGSPRPFLTLPTSCNAQGEGLRFDISVDGWAQPRQRDAASFVATGDDGNGTTGCDRVPFQPEIEVQPTTDEAETPTGLEVVLSVPPDGLENPNGIASSHLKDATVTLPEGMTVNPSQANGLAVCAPGQIGLTSGDSPTVRFNRAQPSCPDASQIGEAQLETPLLLEPLKGAVYLAQQNDASAPGSENPFNSDLALYIAIEGQGILVKLAGEVAPDPRTGRLVTRFLNNPQQPFSRFALKFKGGQRAPLSTPPVCGRHAVEANLTPWARPNDSVTVSDEFQISKGPNGGPCPSGGVRPFNPGFTAGSLNNNAASYSAFVMRLTRRDGEQDLTKFSSTLPPGVLGKLAGVEKCSEAQIAAAKARNESGEGKQEIAAPSCPAGSQIGRIEAGAGVGSIQTYVDGKLYLAGPYNGAPLSVVVITPAVAGPFDLGTVVVREALDLDPRTAEVQVDGANSDPIPHILAGIPLRLRDLRVHVDRDRFILNPTSCDPSSVEATLFGSFLDVLDPGDDRPVELEDRFQAANCAALGFKPRLDLRLRGGMKRGGHPGLRAVYVPRPGDANLEGVVVRLPRSAFLDQANIRTICTRVQFAQGNCPRAAQYGFVRAWTPLLDEPLQGPVYLRSSDNKLPDLLLDLKGLVDVEVAARIDSVNGGIRATIVNAPDAPITKVMLTMQGGRKGLIVNSRNLCRGKRSRANVGATGHNGKVSTTTPVLRPQCGKQRKAKRSSHRP